MVCIRSYDPTDWPSLWAIIKPVFREGVTYAVPRNINEDEAHRMWVELPHVVQVAVGKDDHLIGSYFLKPNHSGPGDHVANCGYLVAESARGLGVAGHLCEHSLRLAREVGFAAMQYNLVVSTNHTAIRLWQRHGFAIAGVLPNAFRHPTNGVVDAFVMYRQL